MAHLNARLLLRNPLRLRPQQSPRGHLDAQDFLLAQVGHRRRHRHARIARVERELVVVVSAPREDLEAVISNLVMEKELVSCYNVLPETTHFSEFPAPESTRLPG